MLMLAGVAATSQAQDVMEKKIRYDDLNLSTDTGIKALYQRVRSAADSVCPGSDNRNLAMIASARKCKEDAINQALAQINNEGLIRYYLAKR